MMKSHHRIIDTSLTKIVNRSLTEGGFSLCDGGHFRPDATAWAVLALEAGQVDRKLSNSACRRLSGTQNSDGRITVMEGYPKAFWPTALGVFAWKKATGFEHEIDRAVQFLLKNSGKHPPKRKNASVNHDTAIKGWPWIEDTHSWVEPTALAILALRSCGYEGHERIREAVRMILDRQLPSGGWNYGNKMVFNKELRPIPESTGIALSALASLTERSSIKLSIDYLEEEIKKLRTPLALSWAIFALSGWANRSDNFCDWILESLNLQKKYGSYNTAQLSQLLVAYFTDGDLIGFLL
jgi:hypothetical protein